MELLPDMDKAVGIKRRHNGGFPQVGVDPCKEPLPFLHESESYYRSLHIHLNLHICQIKYRVRDRILLECQQQSCMVDKENYRSISILIRLEHRIYIDLKSQPVDPFSHGWVARAWSIRICHDLQIEYTCIMKLFKHACTASLRLTI